MRTSQDEGRTPPGPRPLPLLGAKGNLLPFVYNPIGYMTRLYRTYGEVVTLARGTTDYVFVFSPEYNRFVLGNSSLFDNFDLRSCPLRVPEGSALSRLFAGLIQMNGTKHRTHRQKIAPAFHPKRIASYLQSMASVVEQKISAWRFDQQRDLLEDMKKLTLSIAVKTMIGLDPEAGGDKLCQLLEHWMKLVFSLRSVLLPVRLRGLAYYRLIAISDELERRILAVIAARRKNGPGEPDVLDMLLKQPETGTGPLTDEELVGHLNFLFFAGHTTTASALSWTIFLLDQHPQVLNELLDELDNGLPETEVTNQQLDRLALLDAVIKESLRLFPPVMWSSRMGNAGFSIGGYDFPSGTVLIHSAYMTHRIAGCFYKPFKFLPERWLGTKPAQHEYIPFSTGPRTCVGSFMAIMEMKLILSKLLRRFRFALPANARIDLGGIMLSSPKNGMPVRLAAPSRRSECNPVRGTVRRAVDLN